MNLLTCFKILQLPSDAGALQAKRAYKAHVRRWHPDQFPEGSDAKAGAEERLKQINVAYALIKEHLATHQAATDNGKAASPARPQKVDKENAKQTQGEKRSWVDTLFKTLNSFVGDRRGASPPPSPGKNQTNREPSFGQVLDEMAGGSIKTPKKRPKRPPSSFRNNRAGYRRHRRSGSSVEGVGSAERAGPVRPVGRIRGIGKPR